MKNIIRSQVTGWQQLRIAGLKSILVPWIKGFSFPVSTKHFAYNKIIKHWFPINFTLTTPYGFSKIFVEHNHSNILLWVIYLCADAFVLFLWILICNLPARVFVNFSHWYIELETQPWFMASKFQNEILFDYKMSRWSLTLVWRKITDFAISYRNTINQPHLPSQ